MWSNCPDLSEKKRLLELLASGMTRSEISAFTGCSLSSVSAAMKWHKLSSGKRMRCRRCRWYDAEKFGQGFCVVKERVVCGGFFCEEFEGVKDMRV